jgi:hypothetical protein
MALKYVHPQLLHSNRNKKIIVKCNIHTSKVNEPLCLTKYHTMKLYKAWRYSSVGHETDHSPSSSTEAENVWNIRTDSYGTEAASVRNEEEFVFLHWYN